MYYYFYIARCADDTLYSGATNNLTEREKKHNEGKGAKYTRSRRPVCIVYSERFRTYGKALKREAEIKKWPKAKKESLISE